MKNLEKFSVLFLVAGFACFIIAFGVLGVWPAIMTDRIEGEGLPTQIPDNFKVYYSSLDEYHDALKQGRDIYVKEACWHCHSQYIRPVSKEALFYGPVSVPGEYENTLNLPQLFGTRRVGPDLVREAGKRTNDWHFAHLYDPKSVVPPSIMPPYRWYFDESGEIPKPTSEAVALVAYLQSLGKWTEDRKQSIYDFSEITMPPARE